jgi:MraZ protein
MDAKGRTSFPAKFRKHFGDEPLLFIILPSEQPDDPFPSLRIYAESTYEQWLEKMIAAKGLEADDPELDRLVSDFNAMAEEVSIDQVGRIGIPPHLRRACSLEKTVAIRGCGDHVEIWDPQILDDYMATRTTVSIFRRSSRSS